MEKTKWFSVQNTEIPISQWMLKSYHEHNEYYELYGKMLALGNLPNAANNQDAQPNESLEDETVEK